MKIYLNRLNFFTQCDTLHVLIISHEQTKCRRSGNMTSIYDSDGEFKYAFFLIFHCSKKITYTMAIVKKHKFYYLMFCSDRICKSTVPLVHWLVYMGVNQVAKSI